MNNLSNKDISNYTKFKLEKGNLFMNNNKIGIETYTTGYNIEISNNIIGLIDDISINSLQISDKIFLNVNGKNTIHNDISLINLYTNNLYMNSVEIYGLSIGIDNSMNYKNNHFVIGNNNILDSSNNIIIGISSEIYNSNNILIGVNNYSYGENNICIGTNNSSVKDNNIIIGDNLQSNHANSLTIGNYNDISENALFVVGNGTNNNRSDSMYIDISGNLYIKNYLYINNLEINEKDLHYSDISNISGENYIYTHLHTTNKSYIYNISCDSINISNSLFTDMSGLYITNSSVSIGNNISNTNSIICGKYNDNSDAIFIVGCGNENEKKDALIIDNSGNLLINDGSNNMINLIEYVMDLSTRLQKYINKLE